MDDTGKPEIAQPHDSLVRNVLANTELAADFLRNYLPSQWGDMIELDSLKRESNDTVASNLSKLRGDLLYSTRFKETGEELEVLVCLEHQSRTDRLMSFRMLEYVCAAYRQRVPTFKKGMKFPYPLAVVLYHGSKPWKQITSLRDLIAKPQWMTTDILNLPIFLIDLATMSPEQLRGHPMICALFDSLQSASAGVLRDRFQQIVARLRGINRKREVLPWLEALFKYYYAVCPGGSNDLHDDAARILTGIYSEKEAGKMATTMLEVIQREGIEKGIERGLVEGMVKGQVKTIIAVLESRFGEIPSTLHNKLLKVQGDEHIANLSKLVGTCQSIKEFQKAL